MSYSIEDRFWSKVEKTSTCWWWRGTTNRFWNYGTFRLPKKFVRAHRFAWELTYGPIPTGRWVLHHCDNGLCARPDHLFLGDAAANSRDMWAKGRGVVPVLRGERNARAKLTDDEVAAIRQRYALGGVFQRELATEHGITQAHVSSLVRGEKRVL